MLIYDTKLINYSLFHVLVKQEKYVYVFYRKNRIKAGLGESAKKMHDTNIIIL